MPVFGDHNVCALPRHDKTIEHTIATAAEGTSVMMWQELDGPDYRTALKAALPQWEHFYAGHATVNQSPISFDPKVWRLIEGDAFIFQPGIAGRSKNRFWTWAVLEHIHNGHRIIANAGHFVAHGWEQPPPPDAAARQAEWHAGAAMVADFLAHQLHKYGLPQVVGIDANRAKVSILAGHPNLHAHAHQLEHGIDWLIFIDGHQLAWKVGTLATRHTESDHPVLDAPARLISASPAAARVNRAPEAATAPRFKPPSPPMIPARWHGGTQTPRTIVMHSMVMACKSGAARACGHFFATENTPTSAHYGVDPDEVIQYVGDHIVAYHCGHNQDSIGIEMADMSGFNLARWLLPNQRKMLDRAADLVADLCLAYDIPAVYVDATGLKAGKHGVTTHWQETQAFHQSTHTDPGSWPRIKFMKLVRAKIAAKKAA